jgi:amino acid transporter
MRRREGNHKPTNEVATARRGEREAGYQPSACYVRRALPPVLGTVDLTAMYLIAMLMIGNAALAAHAGALALTYCLGSGLFFLLPSAWAVAQLAALYPQEGALYYWTARILGGYWGCFVWAIYWLPHMFAIVVAALGLVGYLQGLRADWLIAPWQQGLVMLGVIALTALLGSQRQRTVKHVVNVMAGLMLCAVLLIAVAGLSYLLRHASQLLRAQPDLWPAGGPQVTGFGLAALLYLGASVPLNMAGELRSGSSPLCHLLWGSLAVGISYPLIVLALLAVRGPLLGGESAAQLPYEIITLLDLSTGHLSGSLALVCILAAYLGAGLVYQCTGARLLLVAGLDGLLPTSLAQLNRHRTPARAILLQALLASSIVVLLFFLLPVWNGPRRGEEPAVASYAGYDVMLAVMSLLRVLANLFYFIDLVAVCRRDGQRRARRWLLWPGVVSGSLSCAIMLIAILARSWTTLIPDGLWWPIIGSITLLLLLTIAGASVLAENLRVYRT